MKRPAIAAVFLAGFVLGIATPHLSAQVQRGSNIFPDVQPGSYYNDAVGELYSAGIITGYDDGRFGPNDSVTRGQIAVMLQRFKQHLRGEPMSTDNQAQQTNNEESATQDSTNDTSNDDTADNAGDSSLTGSVTATKNPSGSFRFTTGAFSIDEGGGNIPITVIRAGGQDGPAKVDYTIGSGSATDGDDYERTTGTLLYADGDSTKQFDIRIFDDDEAEGDESVTLTLSNPTNGSELGTPTTATLTIRDDEQTQTGGGGSDTNNEHGALAFSAREYEVIENGGEISITVERHGGNEGEVSVEYATEDGTADTSYYEQTSGTLTFAEDETEKIFTVSVTDNDDVKGNKTVELGLNNPTGGAALGEDSSATLVIVDDEVSSFGTGKLRFSEDEFTAYRRNERAVVTVERIGGTEDEVTVEYETTDGSARSGRAYEETSGSLTFREGESRKAVIIPVVDNPDTDAGATFNVQLSNPSSNTSIGSPGQATVMIE